MSVVVPVYNVEGFVRECIDSILSQSFRDIEVIAVEDCSTDGSADVLAEMAAADPRLRIVQLEQNGGLGNARNEGLKHASGDLVMFVDSDDSIVSGALQVLVDTVDHFDADVVMFDYARTYWWGKVQRNVLGESLASAPSEPITIRQHLELFEVLNVIWNKLYTRQFLDRLALPFPDGYYEDIPWTYPALISAERLVVLDKVLYHYRQRRSGNILRTRSRKHFEIFMQYERLFKWLENSEFDNEWHSYFFNKMVDHTLGIIAGEKRLPRGTEREFFHELSGLFHAYLPANYQWPGGLTRIRYRLVLADRYYTYQTLKGINTAQKWVRSVIRSGLKSVRGFAGNIKKSWIRFLYRVYLRMPVDENLALFSAYWDRQYSGNPKAIFEEAKRRRPNVRGVWVFEEDVTDVPEDLECVAPGSVGFYRALARAKVLVNNVNFPQEYVKREGTIHLQTQHGTPLKSMGLDLRDFPSTRKSMHFGRLVLRVDKWDYNLSSNRYSSEIWKRVFPSTFVNLEFGYPRNDILVTGDDEAMFRVREILGVPPGKKVALYAPTFRDYRSDFELDIDPEEVARALGDEYVLAIRSHYFDSAEHLSGPIIDAGSGVDVQELLLATDLLITDYSSVMFDYAVLNRPIVIFAHDWETYTRERGVYFDLIHNPPGAVARSHAELETVLRSRAYESAEAKEQLEAFRSRFCSWEDGHAAENVVETLWPNPA